MTKPTKPAYETLAQAYNQGNWHGYLDQHLNSHFLTSNAPDQYRDYKRLSDDLFKTACEQIARKQSAATQVLEWVTHILDLKQSQNYFCLNDLFVALEQHAEIKKKSQYQLGLIQWQNHQGKMPSTEPNQDLSADEYLIALNTQAIQQYEHIFDFESA